MRPNPAMLGQVPIRGGSGLQPGPSKPRLARRMGQDPEPAPAPSPSPEPGPGPSPDGGRRFFDRFFFFPPFLPQLPPYAYPPERRETELECERDEDRSEDEGIDVFICRRRVPATILREPVPAPAPGYQALFLRPLFPF